MPVVRIPDEEEFRKGLKEVLAKPDEWYLERVDRAVKGWDACQGAKRFASFSQKALFDDVAAGRSCLILY